MPQKILSAIERLKRSPCDGVPRSRVVVLCPERFACDRPFLVVLFFHGYESLCGCGHRRPFEESLRRHHLARQLAESGRNAILVVPRIALSSREHRRGGPFPTASSFEALLSEAESVAARLLQAPKNFREAFRHASLVLTGFSGGHHALSALAAHPGVMARVKAIAFFDALYDDDLYAREPAGLLGQTALVCINRIGYDRDNGPKEANYRRRLAQAGVELQRLDAVRSLRPGMAILERIAEPDHCAMVAAGDCLLGVLKRIDGEETCL